MDNHDINQIVSQVVSQMKSGCDACNTSACNCVTSITLAQAKRLIDRVEKKAAEIGVNAVVAVIAATVLYMALRKAMKKTNLLPKL